MRRFKKIIAGMLAVSLLAGNGPALNNAQNVVASQVTTQVSDGQATTQPSISQITESTQTTTQSTTEQGQVSTEQGTTQITTEATTTEVTTAQATTQQVNENLVASGLSPAKAKVILIDPGHCKTHPGASGNGLKEEVAVLDISMACRDALDAYGDVTVYMTRETGDCCKKLGLGACLIARNNYARRLNADFLVSMHLNAGGSNGAYVLSAYSSGFHDSIRVETQKFGKIVLKKLNGLGIRNRGLLLRKSGSGNRYSNGRLADYYSIVRNGVIQNIPSVIIEHGYITSASDCSKYFNTAAKRAKTGQADADAIIEYYDLSKKVIKGKLTKDGDASYYRTEEGKNVSGWVKIDETWYYFDEQTGKMVTGLLTQGKDTFYLNPSGQMVVGWFTLDGKRYLAKGNGTIVKGQAYNDGLVTYLFDDEGKLVKNGFCTISGDTYYVKSNNKAATGVTKISGKYYGFDTDSGKMLYGYQKVNGKYYYFDKETGVAVRKQFVEIDGVNYYFNSNAAQKTGWVTYEGNKYYFDSTTGKMAVGWKKIGKKYYYFNKSNGKLQKNKWIGNYYVNNKGIRTKKK